MIQVVVIGSGNVAQHLIKAFAKSSQINIAQVYARQEESLTPLLDSDKITTTYNNLIQADIYIIAVSDDAIAEVSSQLPFENRLVVHTSGGVDMKSMDTKNRSGVFYPLQSFSKNIPIDFSTIPLCLETEKESDYEILEKLAQSISSKIFKIDSQQRKALHVSAVFVNNFVNHLYQIGHDICQKNKIPFEILNPLILETANKVMQLSPKEAQTGPAKRNDKQTIQTHLNFLSNENQSHIYKIITQSIQNNGKEL